MNFDARRYWPQGDTRLLLKAAYHADRNAALAAWREWERKVDFETAPWNDVRIAAVAIRNLGEPVAASPFAPRLAGMRRFVWSGAMARMKAVKPLLEQLHGAGVPFVLFKGAARIAQDPAAAAERYLQDVDILIDFKSWKKAADVVFDNGYRNMWKLDRESFTNYMHQIHHSLGVVVRDRYEVDFHHFITPLNRQLGADDDLWRRARAGTFLDLPVMLPHPSDHLAVTLSHAIRYSPNRSYEWVGDALKWVSSPEFDWALFEEAVTAREFAAHAVALLGFLQQELAVPVPEKTLARLRAQLREPFITELDAYHSGWGGEIDAEHHCRAYREAEAIRCANAAARTGVASAPAERGARTWPAQRLGSGSRFRVPVPRDVGLDETLRLDINFRRGFRDSAKYIEVLVRAFDDFILEFARWRADGRSGWRTLLRPSTISIDVPGSLVVGRGIIELKVTVRPSEEAVRHVGYRWRVLKER